MISKLYGWSVDQWALALGWFEQKCGYLPFPGLSGAREVMSAWYRHRAIDPGEVVLYGVKPPVNVVATHKIFTAAINEIYS